MDIDETKVKGKTVRSDHCCLRNVRPLEVVVGYIMKRLVKEQNGAAFCCPPLAQSPMASRESEEAT